MSDVLLLGSASLQNEACHGQPKWLSHLQAGGCELGGVVAAHAVDSSAWRGGGRTNVDIAGWRAVMTPGGAEEELT